jgi:hypothetical protein
LAICAKVARNIVNARLASRAADERNRPYLVSAFRTAHAA